ncbi:neuroblast differentiation-associated protein AHNAK-like [Emys orbicularis]|uniref:neuroblast differentiation-associated protein AHNAK-like n=1 Tax=Emys orbicularis TaxID=82168 RepID=UPI0031FBD55F
MSHSQESMEVTLKTEVESGASGFSVTGGGNEGIFVKQVLKGSPASKIFSLREGDQLLSATIFFDNIKYEDALKILQYSEPYKVQFSLKRKLAGKEELEKIHSTAQHKKEKISQEKELTEKIPATSLEISEKIISEEDKEKEIVKQRVGRTKRPRKERLSWPKFQSMKNKKILGHRRSHSTSDAYEHAIQDISPTSTDTESQLQQEEFCAKEKKGSQKKLKFPNIGFKMHRTKAETEEKQRLEIKTLTPTKKDKIQKEDISMETPEILTVQYSTSAYETKAGDIQDNVKKDLKDMENGLPIYTKKYPEVEINIKKQKNQLAISKPTTTTSQIPPITTQISKPTSEIQTPGPKDTQSKQIPQALPRTRKKKQKSSSEQKPTKISLQHPGEGITNKEMTNHLEHTSVQIKGLEIKTTKETGKTKQEKEINKEYEQDQMQISDLQENFGIYTNKGKQPESEITLHKVETDIHKKTVKIEGLEIDMEVPKAPVQIDPVTEDSGWTMQMPSLKMPKLPKADIQAPKVDITLPSVDVSLRKAEVDIKGPEATAKVVKIEGEIKATDKDAKGKESKFKMPKFSMPSFGWSTSKETSGGVADVEASLKEPQVTMPSARAEGEITVSGPAIQAPSVELEIGTSAGKDGEKGKIKMPDAKLPSVKLPKVKAPQVQVSLPKVEADISLPKSQAGIKEGGFEVKVPDMESSIEVETGKAEATGMKIHMPKVQMPSMGFSKPEIKAPKVDVDVTLPKVDVTLPTCDVSLQEADLKAASVPGDVKISAPGVKIPKIEGSIQLKGPGIEAKEPSAELAVEGTEGKAAGLEGKIQMPKFEKPKFGVSLPKGKVPEGEISSPKMEVDIPKPKVKGQVGAIGVETPTLAVEADVPNVETEASGWKIQMPSLKMPKMPKADIQAPKVDITLPSVDVSLPKAEMDIKGPEATAKAVKIEGEIKATDKDAKGKESKFKMPKFSMPSFGWSTTKETSGGVADVEVSLKEPQVTMPSARAEGEITVSGPAIQAPSVELEIGTSAGKDGEKGKIKMPDVKLPSVKLPKVKGPQVQVSLPKVEADISLPKSQAEIKEGGFEVKVPDMESSIEVETEKAEATGMKIHMPKVKMPSMGFSKPEFKAPKVDVDVTLPKVDVTLPTCDVSLQEADLKADSVPGDVKISAPGVKIPKIEGSIQLKGPGIEAKEPSAELAVEGPEGKAAGLEGKIQMPKFEKPKFGVSLPKGKVPQGEISLPKMEVDIPKPKVKGQVGAIGVETPTLAVEADVPDVETEASGWKIQMPSLKMPKMPKADIQAPKVDITLPSVDVSLPKAEVDIKGPEATAKAVKIEGEIKATDKDAKGKESKFKMPTFGMPSFGWSTSKETSGGVADVEASLKEPRVTIPSARAEGEITVSGPVIQAPSVELEIGTSAGKDGEKGKIKMPDAKLPSVKLPKVKAPQVQVSLPKVDADISLPKSQAEIKEGGFEVKVPDMESSIEVETGKAEATGMKIHMPKVQMPSIGFSKPKTKAPKVDVDVTLPKVDVTLPRCDVSLQEADLKAASVPGDVKISAPGVKIPKIEGSIQLKGPGIEAKEPSAELAVEGPEGKAAGLEGKIQMPKFEKPKFGVSLPKGKVPEGEISLPKMEVDIPKPKVKGQVGAIGVETPTLAVEADVPDVETEASGWKIQMPSLKMPKMPKADIQAPKVDITLPSVDVSLPKAEVDIKGPEATAKAVKIEGEIKATDKDAKGKESKFKMPTFGMPSFGWSTSKETSGGVADVEASLKEPRVTIPSARAEGEITVSGPVIQAPNVELEIGTSAGKDGEKGKIKMPDAKLPSEKLPKVKAPQVQVSLPKVDADISLPKSQAEIKEGGFEVKVPDMESSIEVETGKAEATGMKIHMPKVQMPSIGFSKPKTKAPKVDVDVTLPKVDVTLPRCDVSLQEADLKAASVPGDVKISAPGVKIPKIEGSIQLKGPGIEAKEPSAELAVEGPEGKAAGLEGKIQMPKFEKPKFGVSLPKGKVPEGEISLPKMEVDIPKPKVKGQVGAIGVETPTLAVEADVPDVETEASGWKIQMPSLKMPKADIQAPKVDITLPSVDVSLPKAEVDIKGPEATAKAVKIEGEIKATDKDAKGKESKFKMPTFGMPSFGWSTSKETNGGVADVEASLKEPRVSIPSARAEGEITVSGPVIQAPSVELEIGTSAGKDGEKGKIKMPDAKLPSVKLPKVKAPQVQVSLPKVEADISLPKSQAEIKEGGFEVKVPDMESSIEVETGKAEATGMKIHMPKVQMPSIGFSKPKTKAPKVDVDVTLPKVDVTLPSCDVSLQEADLKAASVPGDVKISAPGVKIPKIEGSIQLKGPGIEAKEPSAELAVEGPEGKAAGLEGKIQMPKFEKPKFGVSLPKGKVPEGESSLPKMEADIPKPKVKGQVGAIGVETPTLAVESDVPDVETEASGWKIQMPSLKMPKMPKADIQAPKVDITLPSVDVSLPKAEMDIKGPEATAKAVKIEGEIKATDKDAKGKESKFKMPTFGMPSFGWSTSKETSGGVADVEASLKEPRVTMPSARAEGEITVSGPVIQAPSVELEIGTSAGKDGEKGKIKMPDAKLPSVKLSKVKAPQVQVSLPKVEADISLPKSQAGIKEGGFEVKVPDMESSIEVETGKAEATGMKIHMPKVQMPSMGFSKPEIKAPKVDVDVTLPKVDVTLPTCDVSLQEADLKAASVPGDVKISAPGVKIPKIEGSIQLKGPGIEAKEPSAELAVEGPEGKAAGLEGKIQMPKFEKPKFGVSLPKGKVPQGEISLPKMEVDIPKPKVKGQVGAIGVETPTLAVEADVPDVETEASGWKIQMPSLKMPKMPKADIQAPKVDITLPSVDVSLPKAEVDIKGPEATAKAVKIEGEIKATDKDARGKESKFKMPTFGMPSFGWSTSKETSGGVADVEASLKEPRVTIPSARAEGEITVSGPVIQAPSVELEIGTSAGKDGEKGKIKMPDAKLPSEKLPKVKAPQVQVSLPKVDADISLPKSQAEIKEGGFEVKVPDMESSIEVETGKAEATGMKIHMPKVQMPSMGFSKPEIKAPKVDVDVTLPKVDVTLPTCDVSLQEADLKAASVPGDVKISAPGVKIPKIEGSIQLKGPGIEAKEPSAELAVEGPEGKAAGLEGKIQMPKFEKPKFGVSLPKGKVPEGEISLPKMEVDIPKTKVKGQVGAIGVETPTLAVEADVPKVETEASGWKIQMPSLKMPKMPKADIQAPKVDITLPSVDVSLPKAEVDIKGPEATAKAVKIEGEIKATDKDAKGKESKFKMPTFGMPSFGWSTSKETNGGVADVEASLKEPRVTIPSARAEGEITVSGPVIQAPSVELEIGTSAGKDGEKGKIKMPDAKLPSVKLPKVKAPQVQVSLPKVDADISLPKSQAEIKEGGFEVKVPDMESSIEVETGKAEATGMKIHMPKVQMPSIGFSKPKTKAPKVDVDVTLPKVDVTLPRCDVSLQEADLKAASVPGDVKISAPGVKIPKIEGSIQLKGPGIEAKEPSAELAVEGPEGKAAGLEGKIQMPKFEKPKFGVSLPKGKVPEGESSLPKMEADIPKPKVKGQVGAIGVETPTLAVESDVPDVETEASGWKIQMPSLKMPKMPKADIQAPKVDITLPSVDVSLPKAEMDIKGPEATAKAVKIEGEIKATDKDAKGKESKFKMPTFGMPSFGWSTSKETSGGVADVEASLKEPRVTMPSARAEGEITVSGPVIQAPSVELEIGTSAGKDGEKGKIKMPDAKLPSVKLSKVKAPQVQVSLPKVEADISLPKSQAGIKEGGFEVKVPDMESSIEVETGKAEATGMKIHMPKVQMPSMGFSKPEIKAPKVDVDVTLPKVDVTLPTCDVSLQEADLKAASLPGDVKISAPGVKIPKIEGSIQLKGPGIEAKEPSAELAVEGPEGKAAGLEGKIQMPKFEKPKFGVSLPKGKVPEGEISLPKMEADIPKTKVKGQVGAISVETPTLAVEADVPDVETEASGWKIQMPSLKMPKMPKADIQAPKVDITLPSVDISLPKAEMDIKGPEATAKAVKIEGEIKATDKDAKGKESKFKIPTFGMPSFGWSTSKETSGGVADVEASLKEPRVTMPSARAEGEITVSGPVIQAPSVELEIGTSAGKDGEKGKIKMPDAKLPSVKLPKVKAPQVQVSLPKVEADISLPKSQAGIKEGGFEVKVPDMESSIEVETGKAGATGMKIHMPKVQMPSMGFSKPEIKAPKVDVDVTLPKVDVTLPTCDVSLQEADLKAASLPGGVKISAPGVKIPKIEGSIQLKGPGIEAKEPSAELAVEGPEGKAAGLEGKIQMPKFEKPKFGVSLPKGKVPEGEISLLKMEADIPKPKVKGQVGAIGVETPTLAVEADVPDVETEASGWKIQMPSLKMPKMPKADIQAPKVDITLPSVDVSLPKAEMDIKGPEATAKAVKIEGEIKATDKDAKGKESKFKMPTFGMPSFGWSTSKETSGGVADVEASLKEPRVTMPSARAEGEITVSGPAIQAPSVELEIGTSAGKDGEKGKIKMPDAKLPSVKLPKVKAPQVQVSLPKVDADISLPKSQAGIKEGGFEVKVPDMESSIEVETGKAEATGMKIHMPKVQMPSMGFSKPEIKAPKVDVDVTLPKVDVTLPTCDVSLQEADLKAASVPGDVKISAPGVKIPKIEGSIQLKGPGIEAKEPSAELAVEGPEGKAAGLEGKIQMPKFEKPKFGVSLPKGKVPEGKISSPKMEADIPKPKVKGQVGAIGVETPTLAVEADVPDVETEASGWKIQMPSLKMPKMPKADIQAPKVDITLPSVDVSLPKAEVDIKGPEATAKAVKIEGEIKATDKDGKGKESKFKMPTFGMPSFGWSTSKETSGGVADVEASLKEPQVTIPPPRAEGEITVSGPVIQAPSVELEIGTSAGKDGEKGKIKMPDAKLPSVKLPKVKAPQVQVSLPKVEADISLPKSQAGIKEGGFEVKVPDMESSIEVETGKAEATGMKIHMPKVQMPSMGFSKPEIKAPKVDVDVTLPKVDVTLPTCDVSLQEADLKAASLPGDVKISAPGVKIPKIEGSIQLKGPGIEAKEPSAELAVEGPEGKAAGLEGKIQMPKFEKPKFGVSLPKGKVPEGEISLPKMEADISKPKVKGQVGTIGVETPTLAVEADVPNVETEASGWKIQMPSLKMPKMPKADIQAPKVDITLPSVDVSLPKAEVDIKGPEATAKAVKIEGEIKATDKDAKGKESKFKMPTFGMPSFGWSTSKRTSYGVADVETSLKEPQVTIPPARAEGEITVSGPAIQAPSVGLEIPSSSGKDSIKGISKMPHFKIPKVSISKIPKSEISDPNLQADVLHPITESNVIAEGIPLRFSGPESSVDLPECGGVSRAKSVNLPKFWIPDLGFSKVDISTPKVYQDANLLKDDVTLTKYHMSIQEPKVISGSAVSDVSIPDTDIKVAMTESSTELKSPEIVAKIPSADIAIDRGEMKLEGFEGKTKMPKFQKMKFGISLPKGEIPESEISLPQMEADIPKPKAIAEVTEIAFETSSLYIKSEDSDAGTDVSGLKMQLPSLKMPQIPKADGAPKVDISLPSVDVTMPTTKVDIRGPDLESKVVKTESEIKSGEKDIEGKESKFKMPKFKLPSFSWSPKKEAVVTCDTEATLEEPTLASSLGETEAELTLTVAEVQCPSVDLESDMPIGKDGEKGKTKKPQFSMPKISLPKMKGHKAQVSLPKLESDISGPKPENEGDVSVQRSEKGSSGDGEGIAIKMPKVKISTSEFSKPEIKAPKMDMDVSLPTVDVTLPTYDVTIQQADLKLRSAGADVSLSAPAIKIPTSEGSIELQSPETGVEGISAGIAVDGAEMKVKGLEGKIKMPKFQKPKFGISRPKGKVPESEISLPKMEADVPQLKAMTDIVDIAVEAPTVEVESVIPNAERESSGWKIKMPKIPEADIKTPKVDINLQSNVSVPVTEIGIQDSNMASKATMFEGEIKPGDTDMEGKEGHFKLPKFKLPSFSWSPKKEESIKADFEAPLEEPKITVSSGKTDTKLAETVNEEQGPSMALDIEISTGKEEQKSQIKKPQFIMPRISFSKIKVPKSQVNLPKVEADVTVPKPERDGEDLVQIPDIESSHTKSIEEGAQISIKMPKVQIPTLEFSKPEIKVPKSDMDISLPKADATFPTYDVSLQQADLKLGSAGDDVSLSPGIKFPTAEASIELKGPETGIEGPLTVDGAEVKVEGLEGKMKMPKFQKPKFEISLPKGKRPESEISLPKMEAGVPQLSMTTDIADIAVEAPILEIKSDVSDAEIEVSAGKMKMPQVSITDIKAPEMDVSLPSVSVSTTEVAIQSPEVEDMKMQGKHETKSGEIQTEEHQGWFKMPKFRMPTFARSSSKEKRGDIDSEGSLEKPQVSAPSAEMQTEIEAPEYATSLPHVDTESAAGKDVLEGKIKSAKAEIPKVGVSLHKDKSSDVTSSKFEAEVSLPPEKAVIKVSIPETKTYADVVKCGAEGQQLKTHTPKVMIPKAELSTSEISASKTGVDISLPKADITLPKFDLTLQEQKAKSECAEIPTAEHSIELKSPEIGAKAPSVEIALDGTQKKLDALPKVELDILHAGAGVKTEKLGSVIKSTGKDVQGRESKLKMPKFSVPSFGWPATKGTGDVADVKTNLEETKIGAPGIKMDTEISVVDHEIEFPAESVEKDISAGVRVKVEVGDEASKMKTSKFKMPKFGVLHSKAKGSEVDVFLPKLEADVSLPKTELGIVEIQFKKADGSIDLQSPSSDLMESSTSISKDKPDKQSESVEVNIKIPKLKIPAFTYNAPTVETDVSTSKVATDLKGAGTDIETPKLEVSTKERPEFAGGNIQTPSVKIPTLAERDIKTPQVYVKVPDSSVSKAALQIQGPVAESKEIKTQGEVESGHVDIETHETYSSQIVKESEIPSSEIKTASFGFSLLKVKIPESHVKLDMPVKLQSYTEYKHEVSESEVHQPKLSDENLGVAIQKTGTAEFKLSGKPQSETDESNDVVSSSVSLPKLKTFTVEVQPSSKLGDTQSDKQPEEIAVSPLSKDDEIAKIPEDEEKDMKDQKEKTDSKRSSGRFKFWLPSIGFSSSVDDTGSDSKPEVQKSIPEETQPVDSSVSDTDSSKQTEKTGWFRFPKLGFSSSSKKAKNVDKEEETNLKEMKTSDDESPSERPETFFDAEESLSPKEETIKGEENETTGTSSNVQVSGAIVTSSARTELILLERERASQQSILEKTTK